MSGALNKLWGIFTPHERRNVLWALVLMVLIAVAETVSVISIMPFLSVLGRPSVIEENHWLSLIYTKLNFSDNRSFILALGAASTALVLASSAFKTVVNHIINRYVHLQRHSLSARLLSRYLRQPYEFFLTHNPSLLTKNVLSEADQLMFGMVQPLSQLFAHGVIVLAMTILVFWYDPLTAIYIVATLGLLYGVIYGLVRKHLARIGRERQIANGQRYKACNEAIGGIKDLKVTHTTTSYLKRFEHASREFSRHSAAGETLNQSPLYMVESIAYAVLILVALLLLARSGDIAHVLPALGLYGFASYRMLPAAQVIYRGISRLKFSTSILESIHHDLTLSEEPEASTDSTINISHEIRLKDIHFAYPSRQGKPVFEGFNLSIPANTSVGISGKSGSGKSTLMDLLLGLLTPQSGSLLVDGNEVTEANMGAWQRSIGYVPQHIYLADTSVAENIAFGVAPEAIDRAAVERAARAAQIHDFVVRELPNGYDTQIGDRGIRLSGGQRQRIGVARAMYRDPSVLFLDEATSALDIETEEAMNQAVQALAGEKTIVLIAHREASLRFCEKVINIENSIKSMNNSEI